MPSGFQAYPDSTRQPTSFTYPPIGSTAPPLYNTTSSGWPAPSGVPRWMAGSGSQQHYNTSSYFGGQNTVPAASMMTAASPYHSRGQSGSALSSEYNNSTPAGPMAIPRGPRQYSAPFGENTASGYQNQYSAPGGSTAPSGFEVNMAPALRNPYSAQTTPSVQRESIYASTPRPNLNIIQSDYERFASSGEDPIDEVIREIEKSSLRGQPYRRSSLGTLFQ